MCAGGKVKVAAAVRHAKNRTHRGTDEEQAFLDGCHLYTVLKLSYKVTAQYY